MLVVLVVLTVLTFMSASKKVNAKGESGESGAKVKPKWNEPYRLSVSALAGFAVGTLWYKYGNTLVSTA